VSIGSPAAIESVLQGGPSFWDRDDVKQALAQVPGDACSFTYQDTGALIGTIFQTFVQLANNPETKGEVPVDTSAIPDASVFTKYWGDSVGYLTRDSQGYSFKSTLEYKK
jgi:hypothetical protein